MRVGISTFWLVIVLCSPAASQGHLIAPGEVKSGATTLEAFNARIEDSATDYLKQYPPGAISRIVIYDAAFPLTMSELKASRGYGVVLLSVFSRNAAELPPAAVYVAGVPLKLLGGKSRVVLPESRAAAAFGSFRVDSIWLVPANLYRSDAEITVDFAKNRKGFVAGRGLGRPSFLESKTIAAPTEGADIAVIKKIVEREYPDMGIDIAP